MTGYMVGLLNADGDRVEVYVLGSDRVAVEMVAAAQSCGQSFNAVSLANETMEHLAETVEFLESGGASVFTVEGVSDSSITDEAVDLMIQAQAQAQAQGD